MERGADWLCPWIFAALNKKTMEIAIITSTEAAVMRYVIPVAWQKKNR